MSIICIIVISFLLTQQPVVLEEMSLADGCMSLAHKSVDIRIELPELNHYYILN